VADLAPILPKLGKLIRLLDSDQRGEIAAAFHGLKRTLASAGAKFGDLAELIESVADGKLYTEEEMQTVLDELRKDYAPKANGNPSAIPSLDDMTRWIHARGGDPRLRSRDREFVDDMHSRVTFGIAYWTGPRRKWITDLYVRLGGRV
jgi:hypothetical protein